MPAAFGGYPASEVVLCGFIDMGESGLVRTDALIMAPWPGNPFERWSTYGPSEKSLNYPCAVFGFARGSPGGGAPGDSSVRTQYYYPM
jgi:hypothetical protein